MASKVGSKAPKPSDETLHKATLAQAQLMAPMYTQHLQPVGTPARKVKSSSVQSDLAPLWTDIASHIRTLVDTSNTKALDDIRGWFTPRYANHVAKKGGFSVSDTRDIMRATGFSAKAPVNAGKSDSPPKPDEVV